jgi:hypothetical protein
MAGIIDFPQVVQQALRDFGDLFANEPQRRHFAEYLTGLYVAARKTVTGIHAEFARTTDQSCLNRFVHHEAWDELALNQRRLDLLQHDADTRYSDRGVIPIDNTLIDHDGQLIDDVGWFWDHAEERYKIAHDYLIANYVCSSGKHYPLEFRCFRKQQQCEADQVPFTDHTELFKNLVDWVDERPIPGTFAMDSYTLRGQEWHIVERLKSMHQKRFHLAPMFGREVIQALVDCRSEALERLVVGRVQRLLADEPPQPLDQVQVGRVARQVQHLDPQGIGQALHPGTLLVASVVQHQRDRQPGPRRGYGPQQGTHGLGIDVVQVGHPDQPVGDGVESPQHVVTLAA